MAILSEACKRDNKWGLRSNFVNVSLNQTLLKFLLCVRQTWMTQFLCERLSSLMWKDSSTHRHGLAVYIKEELPFACNLSLENSADSYLCFRLALLHSVPYFFPLSWSPSLSLCMVFDSISSKIDEVLLINPSANVFVLRDFNIDYKDWLTYSGEIDRPG